MSLLSRPQAAGHVAVTAGRTLALPTAPGLTRRCRRARLPAASPAAAAAVSAAAAAAPPPNSPQQQAPAGAHATAPTPASDSLAASFEEAFHSIFTGDYAAPRVLESWRRLCSPDPPFEKHWPGLGLQRCNSYLPRLPEPPPPFPDVTGPGYEWLLEVERSAGVIMEEFERMMENPAALEAAGNAVWVPAARDDALSYGPDWRTLVLQDRGEWEKHNSKLFPRTKKVFEAINAPTLELFFARQTAGTGIASHTDDVNFIQTSHLGLRVPEGECWMKCGDVGPRRWEAGRVVAMDTSFMHETWNGAGEDRYVLIMRHWHPGTTPLERIALQFFFDCIDRSGTRFAANKARKQLAALNAAKPKAAPAAAAAGGNGGGGAKKGGGRKKK